MERARFFHQQANCVINSRGSALICPWAHKLNLMGNKLTAKARQLWSQERKARQTQKLVDA